MTNVAPVLGSAEMAAGNLVHWGVGTPRREGAWTPPLTGTRRKKGDFLSAGSSPLSFSSQELLFQTTPPTFLLSVKGHSPLFSRLAPGFPKLAIPLLFRNKLNCCPVSFVSFLGWTALSRGLGICKSSMMLLLARAAGGEIHKEHDKPTQAVPLHPPTPCRDWAMLVQAGDGPWLAGPLVQSSWSECLSLLRVALEAAV